MTTQQTKAVNTVIGFAQDKTTKGHWYGLYGGPGVGKTYTINNLKAEAEKLKLSVAVTATTGKAASLIDGQTLHSYLGMRMSVNPMAEEEEDAMRIGNPTADVSADILIIDEASMMDRKTVLAVQSVEQRFSVILLVGDTDQLPPVKSKKPQLFKIPHTILTVQQRMKNGGMQKLVEDMRLLLSDDLTCIDLDDYADGKSVHLIDSIPIIKQGQCALAYHNKRVEAYIPEQHGDEYSLFNNVTVTKIAKMGFADEKLYPNGYDLTLKLTPLEDAYLSVTKKGGHYRMGSLLFPKVDCPNQYLAEDEVGNKFIVHKGSNSEIAKLRQEAFDKAKGYREELMKKHGLHKKLSDFKGFFTPAETVEWNKLWSDYSSIATIVHIRPTESRTIHKSQGSTMTDVFVDMDDIQKANGEILHALYTAFSRATDNLYIKGSDLRVWGANS